MSGPPVEAWWYRTRWWWYTNWLSIDWNPNPLHDFHIDGQADWNWDDSDVWTTDTLVRILGHYGVSANRTPSWGRYRSTPTLGFGGRVEVSTGDSNWIFLSKDEPSAWVAISYTQNLWNGPVDRTASDGQMLVDLRNDDYNTERGWFNTRDFPSIEFDLHPNSSVHVNLEVKIRYFVEGDAAIDIGGPGHLYMSLRQWDIEPG